MFWRVSFKNRLTGEKDSLILQSPNYEKAKIIKTMSEVHPEYEDLDAEEIERPSWLKRAYGDPD